MGVEMINEQYKKPIIIVVAIVVALLAYSVLTTKDNRSTSDRISDAFHQLEDRTPGEKLGDAVKDTGD